MSARHAVVLGATGMLRAATLGLVERGFNVTAVARNQKRLSRLEDDGDGKIRAVALDYRDGDQLAGALSEAEEERGDVALIIAWIHSVAPDAPLLVARTLATGHKLRYAHVLGSAAADPAIEDDRRRRSFDAVHGVAYQEVILGFVREAKGSRWLTNEEISAGVLHAVDSHASRSIVGTVRPWDARP